MAEVESAEEFAYELDHCNSHSWSGSAFDRKEAARLIRERDTAIREAAKLEGANEVLNELARVAGGMRWSDYKQMLTDIYKKLRTKYQSADSQPAQDGERR